MASNLPSITKKQGMQILRLACPGGSFSDGMMERCECKEDYWNVIKSLCYDFEKVNAAYLQVMGGAKPKSTKKKSTKKASGSTKKKKGAAR
jgi:hypothetical protein